MKEIGYRQPISGRVYSDRAVSTLLNPQLWEEFDLLCKVLNKNKANVLRELVEIFVKDSSVLVGE